MTDTNTQVTHLSLLRKYAGKIMRATTEEMRAAVATIPAGKNALKHLFEAMRIYSSERAHMGLHK